MASPTAQAYVSSTGGQMPARIDLASTAPRAFYNLPLLVQANLSALRTGAAVLAYKLLSKGSAQYNSELATQAQNFFSSGDPTAILAYMSANYAELM
jgi:hypothetical protein